MPEVSFEFQFCISIHFVYTQDELPVLRERVPALDLPEILYNLNEIIQTKQRLPLSASPAQRLTHLCDQSGSRYAIEFNNFAFWLITRTGL